MARGLLTNEDPGCLPFSASSCWGPACTSGVGCGLWRRRSSSTTAAATAASSTSPPTAPPAAAAVVAEDDEASGVGHGSVLQALVWSGLEEASHWKSGKSLILVEGLAAVVLPQRTMRDLVPPPQFTVQEPKGCGNQL